MNTLYLGADHGGFELKEKVKKFLGKEGIEFVDLGAFELDTQDDYPFVALEMALRIKKEGGRGILFCRSGVGMSVVANKVRGIRCADVFSFQMAQKAVEHNNCQIISLPADYLSQADVQEIVLSFLRSRFSGEERHIRRLEEIERWEEKRLEAWPALLEDSEKEFEGRVLALKESEVLKVHIDVLTEPFQGKNLVIPELLNDFKVELHLMGKSMSSKFLDLSGLCSFVFQVELEPEIDFAYLRDKNVKIGASLDLQTPVSFLDTLSFEPDFYQIMGVKAGRSGQVFQKQVLRKIVELRQRTDKEIVVDGGIDDITSQLVKTAGADRVISRTFVFAGDILENLRRLE